MKVKMQELLDVLKGFYPLEKQNEMGVVGIRVEVGKDD